MAVGNISQVRFENLRTISHLAFDLDGLTVLIGENGVGKSTLIEGIELLRLVAQSQFMTELHRIHGGFLALLRQGESVLRLGATVSDVEGPLVYDLWLARDGEQVVIAREELTLRNKPDTASPLKIIERTRARAQMFDQAQKKLVPVEVPADALLLASFGLHPPQDAIRRMVAALDRVRPYVAFDTTPGWIGREQRRPSPLRDPQIIEPAAELARYGNNLANAWSALRNDNSEDHWRETMEYVRVGLGDEIESVNVRPDPGAAASDCGSSTRD